MIVYVLICVTILLLFHVLILYRQWVTDIIFTAN